MTVDAIASVPADEPVALARLDITPEQCRAARGWLSMSQQRLAELAGLAVSTVSDFERGQRVPHPNNVQAIKRALRRSGILFLKNRTGMGIFITDPRKRIVPAID